MNAPSSVSSAYFASSSISSLARMIWKSAPDGRILPLMPSPRISPPITGMTRRTPWPISPALMTGPISAVMVKTYRVESTGIMICLLRWNGWLGLRQRLAWFGALHRSNKIPDLGNQPLELVFQKLHIVRGIGRGLPSLHDVAGNQRQD